MPQPPHTTRSLALEVATLGERAKAALPHMTPATRDGVAESLRQAVQLLLSNDATNAPVIRRLLDKARHSLDLTPPPRTRGAARLHLV
jgi:hypothetical protein